MFFIVWLAPLANEAQTRLLGVPEFSLKKRKNLARSVQFLARS
jgi:hypothetical protein